MNPKLTRRFLTRLAALLVGFCLLNGAQAQSVTLGAFIGSERKSSGATVNPGEIWEIVGSSGNYHPEYQGYRVMAGTKLPEEHNPDRNPPPPTQWLVNMYKTEEMIPKHQMEDLKAQITNLLNQVSEISNSNVQLKKLILDTYGTNVLTVLNNLTYGFVEEAAKRYELREAAVLRESNEVLRAENFELKKKISSSGNPDDPDKVQQVAP
jgi:hypothetical protein